MRTTRRDMRWLALALAAVGQVLSGSSCDCLGLKDALKKLQETAEGIEGQGGDATQYYLTGCGTVQEKINAINKWIGYWEKFKTASCIPEGIIPLMRRIMESPGRDHGDECNMLCDLTADWYKKMISPPMPPQQAEAVAREFFFFCGRNCH